ncbi:hypothetical protein ACFPVX_07865 [Cohnella faecalis]|uniref:Cytosolic protein n=1 Tax=Cohnella faecalis TaxID=2315694 RepID=A0A398CS70_9BACL|nr:hypothetical protein [Cohnella faecalis]RIE04079.1 hypothetical protein D3H35_09045 [Cohnella faecalis]
MFSFRSEKKQPTTDLATVESSRNDLTAEEFPEGPYGSDLLSESVGKAEWREDQRGPAPFGYENRELHANLERGYPADHDLHDQEGG